MDPIPRRRGSLKPRPAPARGTRAAAASAELSHLTEPSLRRAGWAIHNRRRRERMALIGDDVDAVVRKATATARAGDERVTAALQRVLGAESASEVSSIAQRGGVLTLIVTCGPVAYRLQRDDGERLLWELARSAPEARISALRVRIGG